MKVCIHKKIQYANCGSSHLDDLNQYSQKRKADINIYKNKTLSKYKTKIGKACPD